MAETQKAAAAKPAKTVTPVDPRGLQPNESHPESITTNPPRGVDEPAANAEATTPDGKREPAAADLQAHVKKVLDSEEARGYRGFRQSKPVPNENYTLKGVGKGLPTPETTVHTPTSN